MKEGNKYKLEIEQIEDSQTPNEEKFVVIETDSSSKLENIGKKLGLGPSFFKVNKKDIELYGILEGDNTGDTYNIFLHSYNHITKENKIFKRKNSQIKGKVIDWEECS